MDSQLIPEYGDVKAVKKLTGYSRQKIFELENDHSSGFPETIRIGRTVRFRLDLVRDWMEAHKPSNAAVLQELIAAQVTRQQPEKHVVTQNAPLSKAQTPKPSGAKRSLAQIQSDNHRILSLGIGEGRSIVSSTAKTSGGISVRAYQVLQKRLNPKSSQRAGDAKLVIASEKLTLARRGIRVALPIKASCCTQIQATALPSIAVMSQPIIQATNEITHSVLKAAYEGGMTLDALCSHFRAGKTTISRLLHQSGAKIVSVQPRHLEAAGIDSEDSVHQQMRWKLWNTSSAHHGARTAQS